jgi:hypothetical protein
MNYMVSFGFAAIFVTLSNWCYIKQRCNLVSTLHALCRGVQIILSCLSSSVEHMEQYISVPRVAERPFPFLLLINFLSILQRMRKQCVRRP